MATPNTVLQQILKDIGSRATQGRINLNWGVVTEARKHKVREAAPEVKKDEPTDELPELDPSAKVPEAPKDVKKPTEPDAEGSKDVPNEKPDNSAEPKPVDAPETDAGEDVDAAKEDAEKAKAELEKAKAEKDQAEQELEQNAYVKLNSPSGVSFLLGKLIGHAFQTNSMDALAGEFVNKLKITNPEDFQLFSDDMIPYKNIPGMVEFLDSVKSLSASGKQEPTEG